MKKAKLLFQGDIRQYAMIIALVLITTMFQIMTKGILLLPQNITNMVQQNSYILILSMGMLICIVSGAFDMSVGSVAAFIGAVSAHFIINYNIPIIPTILITVILGAAIGAFQGYFISYVKVPAFIVTLSGMLIFRGLTQVVLSGRTIAGYPEGFRLVSAGFIPDFFDVPDIHLTSVLLGLVISLIMILGEIIKRNKRKNLGIQIDQVWVFLVKNISTFILVNIFVFWLSRYKGIPNVLVLLLTMFIIYNFITGSTVLGRHIYALGGNEKAARLSGVKTKKVLFMAFVNMGILSAIAGIVFAGRLDAATPKAGTGFELDAIAACYIGGASSSGGIGTVIGAIIGGLVMGVLNNGMSIMGVNVDWQLAIKGFVLLMAVTFDVVSKSKSSAK